ncbi:MAG: 1-acyl-sn-glycerol-3-phosphate acyltransferase [Spirochaetaceae bacterium]
MEKQTNRITVKQRYAHLAPKFLANVEPGDTVSHNRVFQPANPTNRALVEGIIDDLIQPGSTLLGFEHFADLYERAQRGETCLLTSEHFSNFDLPVLHYLLCRQGALGKKIAESIVAVAAAKLNEENRFVRAFTQAYTRIVIYPSRALAAITEPEVFEREKRRSREINMSALREMVRKKNSGHIILVFPAGTRYRPENPDTARGLPEIDGYLKQFDNILPVGIGGNLLLVNPSNDMSEDYVNEDIMVVKAGAVIAARAFREQHRATCPEGKDPKQHVVDRLMERLSSIHSEIEAYRDGLRN